MSDLDITNILLNKDKEEINKNIFNETETENSNDSIISNSNNNLDISNKNQTQYVDNSNIDIQEQTKVIKESLLYLINLLNNCIERGGFQIGEVILINDSIQHLTNNKSSQEEQRKGIIEIIKYIYKAQSLGKLSLEEAYYCHLKVKIFLK